MPIKDLSVIAREEKRKAAAEAEDEAAGENAETLRARGVRVDWLLAMSFALDLWNWKTWEVCQSLVKPATEDYDRCRFADLPFVEPYTGPATVFLSHCWGGKWGDLVAAACGGASTDRIVWIDIFAVRQWPGNSADLNFRGVISGSTALIVALAPVSGAVSEGWLPEIGFRGTTGDDAFEEYAASDEYKAVSEIIPFCRLWCIGAWRFSPVSPLTTIFRAIL
jgi:hypothetical protein